METTSPDIIGETSTDRLTDVAQTVARIHLHRELTSDELAKVLESVPHHVEPSSPRTSWTPPELAREWGVSPDKILTWIRNGELPATNLATDRSRRPRYRIDAEGIAAFKAKRTVVPAPAPTRRIRTTPSYVIEFF